MELEARINWESVEKFNTCNSATLKEFIVKNVDSLRYQLIDKDYLLKFNNNPLMKILLNTNVSELIAKFYGSRIDIELTKSSENEIKGLKKNVADLQVGLATIQDDKAKLILMFKNDFNKDKLYKKLKSLIKPLESNEYFVKLRNKILKRIAINIDIVIKEAKDMKDNFDLIKKNETIIFYNKILEFYLYDMYDFTYKYGLLFLNDKEMLGNLCEIFKQITLEFVNLINENLKNTIVNFYRNYTINLDFCKEYLSLIEQNVVLYRAVRFFNDQQSTVNFKFDSPIKVKFSEITYKDISAMLSTFPKQEHLKANLGPLEKDFNAAYYFYAFERDLRIYQFFNVKIEEYALGFLLYEN